jgi:hypothetical protein
VQFDGNGHETNRYLNAPGADGGEQVQAEEAISTQGSAGTALFSSPVPAFLRLLRFNRLLAFNRR